MRNYLARRFGAPEIKFALERLSALGFRPRQIFDVGAYQGEFALQCLQCWPDARIACFEPLEASVAQLRSLSSKHPSLEVFPGLLGGASREEVAFHEAESASSVLDERVIQKFPLSYQRMTTVDELMDDHFKGSPPDLIKLDVQGYELEVLKGAERTLPKVKAILAELNLLDIHIDVPLVADFVRWLNERGWVAYDICGLHRRPLDQALWQADLIFVPVDSPFRADKRWSA